MVSVVALMALVGAPGEPTFEIIEFSAQWCGPCRTMAPALERLQAAGYPLRKVDVDRQPQVAQQYRVTHLPTIIVLRDGQEISRRVGARSYVELDRWFKEVGVQPGAALPSPGSQSPIARGQSPDTPDPDPGTPMPRRAAPTPAAERNVAPLGAPTSAPKQSIDRDAAVRRALAASVRLKVEDADGYSFGTGTIIDVSGPNALVVTCGHIFRDSQGKGRITVDLFGDRPRQGLPGRLVTYEADRRDIGFVVIQPGVPVTPVPVATPEQPLQVGLAAFSIGCNRGADPTVQFTNVTAVNRYAHGPNLEISGQPVDGRSGGGLFTEDGQLIGICNAADPQENKGIYASLPLVHEHLGRMQLAHLFHRPAGQRHTSSGRASAPPNPRDASFAASRSQSLHNSGDTRPTPPATTQDSGELICVVRDPVTGQQRVIVVPRPSAELIQQLDAAAQQRPQRLANESPTGRSSSGPIMRAQSQR